MELGTVHMPPPVSVPLRHIEGREWGRAKRCTCRQQRNRETGYRRTNRRIQDERKKEGKGESKQEEAMKNSNPDYISSLGDEALESLGGVRGQMSRSSARASTYRTNIEVVCFGGGVCDLIVGQLSES